MTNHPTDPARHSAEDARLRLLLAQQDASRRARWAAIDAKLAQHQAKIDQVITAERELAREQAEVAAQAAAAEDDDEVVVAPAPVAGQAINPAEDLDLLAASSAMGSPAHMEWRRQHSSPDRGIFR